ncbi:SH3 domain-containing protein [Micromonospora sp. NPDC049559]|uniref:SH3 domain-containing protein n=1 Tax=Micromonospora sp. NPDC049559 TaxID=3155923 RepID=UPI00341E1945
MLRIRRRAGALLLALAAAIVLTPASASAESGGTAGAAAADPTVTCDGNGTTGRRVQLVYVRGDQTADRYDQMLPQFRTWANQIDAEFVTAGTQTGNARHVRYVHDANCVAVVSREVIPQASMGAPQSITDVLKTRGYNRSDRKYVVWYDAPGCGLAYGNGGDDRAAATNPYNAGPHYATVGTSCWTWHATAHELLHNLGAVQASAPHGTPYGHCWDDEDIMCYDDGGLPSGGLVKRCAGAPENQIDCNHDDYFNVSPAANSYLATHWNVAYSLYLIDGAPAHGEARTDSGIPVNVRSGPHTSSPIVGTVASGASVPIYCQVVGDTVTGKYGTSNLWDRIRTGGYVSDTYVYTGTDGRVAPNC